MMQKMVAIAGIVVLLVGVIVLGVGLTGGSNNTSTTTVAVVPQTSRTIDANGIWSPGADTLTNGQSVTITLSVASYNSSAGPIFFYVMNESQWAAWGGCAPCTSPNLLNKTVTGGSSNSYSWTVPYSGPFYFVVDVESYGQSASVQFAANSTQSMTTTTSSNPTYVQAGVGVLIVGAVVLAVGIIITGKKKA